MLASPSQPRSGIQLAVFVFNTYEMTAIIRVLLFLSLSLGHKQALKTSQTSSPSQNPHFPQIKKYDVQEIKVPLSIYIATSKLRILIVYLLCV